jgi:hypothetical protein
MNDESTDAVAPAPTRRSMQASRHVPPPLPPTAPVVVTVPVAPGASAAPEPKPEQELAWAPPAPHRPSALAGWALAVAIIGLIVSFVVGWGFPVGIIAIIAAIAALRRPGAKRQAAAWALALGILSVLYSALWIAVALNSGPLF